MAITVRARRLLQAELEDRKISQAKAARAIGVSAPSFLAWLRGNSRPEHWRRPRIETWSEGRIPVESWLTDEEREEIAAAQSNSAAGDAA